MLDALKLNLFIRKANVAHQQFCVWFSTTNEYAQYQARWNILDPEVGLFGLENFTRKHECKYKNFWGIVVPTLQHSWVLSTARLFDSAYHSKDNKKEKPRISLDYILMELEEGVLSSAIREELESYQKTINSLKKWRDNVHAHIDANFNETQIEGGVDKLFCWLEGTIEKIKQKKYLNGCGNIQINYNERLSQCGVDEVFEDLLFRESLEEKSKKEKVDDL